MPDICMCPGGTCPLAAKCFRAQATPGMYQSYFVDAPNKGDECPYYWPMDARERMIPRRKTHKPSPSVDDEFTNSQEESP